MNLDELKPAQKTQTRTRVGRGVGSGLGKTSGRGLVDKEEKKKMDWKDGIVWLLRLATAGILLIGILLGLAISKIF